MRLSWPTYTITRGPPGLGFGSPDAAVPTPVSRTSARPNSLAARTSMHPGRNRCQTRLTVYVSLI